MGIFAWLIIGGIAGWLASMVMKTNVKMYWLQAPCRLSVTD